MIVLFSHATWNSLVWLFFCSHLVLSFAYIRASVFLTSSKKQFTPWDNVVRHFERSFPNEFLKQDKEIRFSKSLSTLLWRLLFFVSFCLILVHCTHQSKVKKGVRWQYFFPFLFPFLLITVANLVVVVVLCAYNNTSCCKLLGVFGRKKRLNLHLTGG